MLGVAVKLTIFGASMSLTVTLNVQLPTALSAESLARQFTTVTPTGNTDAEGGSQVVKRGA